MIGLWIPLAASLTLFGGGSKDVEWEASPEEAAEKARKEGKLLLVVHLSGVFGNPDRT
jgi:hypothetical protein